jgi:hypothetical protein
MKYFITNNGYIVDENDNIVTMEDGNKSFEEYYKFLQEGGTVEEYEASIKGKIFEDEDIFLKSLSEEEINKLQYEELLKTDWVYIRKQELGVDVPEEIKIQRQEIRDKYTKLKNLLS